MSRRDRLLLGSLAVLVALEWLRSDFSRCDIGCQTMAEHLERHVLSNLLRGFLGG